MMRPRLLDRYVGREFMRLFLLFAFSAPALFILIDLTDHLDTYLARGLAIDQVALSYVYQLPLFVLYSFPVAALIATIFTVSGMTRHEELAAAKAGGISFYRFIAPIMVLGVLLTGAALGLSELVPITTRLRAELLEADGDDDRAVRSNFVYRSRGGMFFSIRRLNAERGRMDGIVFQSEGDSTTVPGLHVVARSGVYSGERGGWTLQDGYLRLITGPGEAETFQFARLRPLGFTETPKQLLARPKEPEEMGYAELGRFIETLRRSGGRPLELMVERAQKIALPVATFVIILFAAPMAQSSRRGGAAYGVGISLLITIVYLMLFKVAGAAGAGGVLPPTLAAWLPNLIFFAAALVSLARVRT